MAIFGLICLLALPVLACAVPGIGPAEPAQTATPPGDMLYLNIPAYAHNLAPGEFVPGTGLQYRDRQGDAYEVLINGQPALKRSGDSFYWSGVVAPGLFANYNLRLTSSLFGSMPVAGNVELIVLNPNPVEQIGGPTAEFTLKLSPIVADYKVPVGAYYSRHNDGF
ncbi:MAG: hypothetical protein M5U34_16660 [Chloroflexi bacterium]|nr:hypothetical protein [Chloroflexota bacterium]